MSENNENKAETEGRKTFEVANMPWWLALGAVVLCAIPMYWGIQSSSMAGTMCSIFFLAIAFNELGERLPVWNKYIGGGLLMVFFGVAVMNYFGLIPEKAATNIGSFISDDANFLEFYIVMLIVGSVLALDRDILLRSFVGYIPAILGGLACACALGVLAALLVGVNPVDAIVKYVLPVMGGGNGAGAVPLSNIYEQVTGEPASGYYGFAIIILTIANIFAIIGSALLNTLGALVPSLTGDKTTLLRKGAKDVKKEDKKIDTTVNDMLGAILIAMACFAVGRIMSQKILPSIFGAAIHAYAYLIIFVVILAALGIIPDNIRAAAKRLQNFFTGAMGIVIMIGMGVDFDLAELFAALSPANVFIAFMIVVGAVIGAAAVGYLVGFYPVDSAITAGLCMANRGGNGDLACLGAAHRMELIAYAQLSSRLGGAIVLIIASFVFAFML